MDSLNYWLQPINKIFKDFDKHILDKKNNRAHRIFIDKNSDVLFVAHLDTIQIPELLLQTKQKIYASGLDDRLGCWIAYLLSQELKADLLLTDHEEKYSSTAAYHICKDYNWIAEFDRAGGDVVTYDLDNPQFLAALKGFWPIGFGTFSDICFLETTACCLNLGIGFELSHSKNSFVDIKTVTNQITLFRQFFQQYKDTKFVCDLLKYDDEVYKSSEKMTNCDICGRPHSSYIYGYYFCRACFETMYYIYLNSEDAEYQYQKREQHIFAENESEDYNEFDCTLEKDGLRGR